MSIVRHRPEVSDAMARVNRTGLTTSTVLLSVENPARRILWQPEITGDKIRQDDMLLIGYYVKPLAESCQISAMVLTVEQLIPPTCVPF